MSGLRKRRGSKRRAGEPSGSDTVALRAPDPGLLVTRRGAFSFCSVEPNPKGAVVKE